MINLQRNLARCHLIFDCSFITFAFNVSVAHRDLHSFPTRRSSDLYQYGKVANTSASALFQVFLDNDLNAFNGSVAEVYRDRKSTRLNSSHTVISYAVFCLKKKIDRNGELERRNVMGEGASAQDGGR